MLLPSVTLHVLCRLAGDSPLSFSGTQVDRSSIQSIPWQVEDGVMTGVSFPSLFMQVTHFTSAHASSTKGSHKLSPPSKQAGQAAGGGLVGGGGQP